MDYELYRRCSRDLVKTKGESFEYLPFQNKFKLRPEDEISLDSIFSALLSRVESTAEELQKCAWDINVKDVLNTRPNLVFAEKLFVSKLVVTNCELGAEVKVFLEKNLQQIGKYNLNIEEHYNGFAISSNCEILKNENEKCKCTLQGKYDVRFMLIDEKRTECNNVDGVKVERSLMARNEGDHIVAIREIKINEESRKFKAVIPTKSHENILTLDGGVMLLMRYLVLNNITDAYEYYSINLSGRIIRCMLVVLKERKKIRIFNKIYNGAVCVLTRHYFNNIPQESADSYYSRTGRLLLHYWHDYNYLLHSQPKPSSPPERILTKVEPSWQSDPLLWQHYLKEKKCNNAEARQLLHDKPEISDFLYDYLRCIIMFKPEKVVEFTVRFFQNMQSMNIGTE